MQAGKSGDNKVACKESILKSLFPKEINTAMPMSSQSLGKRIVFMTLMLLVPICAIEVASYFATRHFKYVYFSYEQEYFDNVEKPAFDKFITSAYFDPHLGWNNPVPPIKVSRTNCIGKRIEYNYRNGYRVTPALPKGQETVALFGESYSQGEEVGDDSTISSILTSKYAIPTINYGVNAYDPLQAVEKFKSSLPDIPHVKVAVLLVMHENIWRVVNSFKPVYFPYKTDFYFGLKPYVKNGKVVPINYPNSFQDFLREARIRFAEDYWAKPKRCFPYSLCLAKALFTHSFISGFWTRIRGPFVYEYQFNTETKTALATVLEEFVSVAELNKIRPIVVFVPRSRKSYGCSGPFVRSMNEKWGREIAHEFVDQNLNWPKYRIAEKPDYCHPSEYGYDRIALFMRDIIRKELLNSQK